MNKKKHADRQAVDGRRAADTMGARRHHSQKREIHSAVADCSEGIAVETAMATDARLYIYCAVCFI